MRSLKLLLAVIGLLALGACGGGGSSSAANTNNSTVTGVATADQIAVVTAK